MANGCYTRPWLYGDVRRERRIQDYIEIISGTWMNSGKRDRINDHTIYSYINCNISLFILKALNENNNQEEIKVFILKKFTDLLFLRQIKNYLFD